MKRIAFLLLAMFAVLAVILFPASQVTFSEKTTANARSRDPVTLTCADPANVTGATNCGLCPKP